MKQLVRLWERPSSDGKRFTYYLLYTDEQGKRRQKSLGHADRRKARRHEGPANVVPTTASKNTDISNASSSDYLS